jgi:hypothetical protein
MAKNTNDGYRIGAVKERTQVYNSHNNTFVKRDSKTGQFMSASKNEYKGITTENKQTK